MLPPKIATKPNAKNLKQKNKLDKPAFTRSQSEPVKLDTDLRQEQQVPVISRQNFLQLYSLVLGYAKALQDLAFNKGLVAHSYVKKRTSWSYITAKFHHKTHAFKHAIRILKKMMVYVYSEKLILITAYISMIVTSTTQTKLPQIIGSMIDTSVVNHNKAELIEQSKLFLCIAGVHLVSEFFLSHLFTMLSQRIRWTLKNQVYAALLKREIEYFDKRPMTEILDSVNGLIGFIESICTTDLSNLARNLIQFAYCAYMLTCISYKLMLLIIVLVPVHVLIPLLFHKFADKIFGNKAPETHITDKRITETFQNIRIVKAFSTEDLELKNYDSFLKANHEMAMTSSKSGSLFMGITGFYTNFTLLCLIYVGMILVHRLEVSPGSLSSFLLISLAVTTSFRDLNLSYNNIKHKIPACERLFGILEDVPKIPYKGGKKVANFEGNIEMRNVQFSYPVAPDVPILKNVTLTIKSGESVAFVGMSGGGKSTIISLLLRFYDINDGAIKLDGVDIRDIDLQWLHNQFGYVSQDPILFSGTIEQNITYGLRSYTPEILKKAIDMANAGFIFNKDLFPLGLKSEIGERGNNLSGGQKQRLSIARALMREPKVLILDEATSSLDANAEFEVQTAIDNLLSSSQLTVITIAHRLSTIIKCKVIFVLKSGQVVEKGNHNELVSKGGVYKDLVEKQFQRATPTHH